MPAVNVKFGGRVALGVGVMVGVSVMLVVGSGVSVLFSASAVVRFVLAGLALAAVAALVGVATDELGSHVGAGSAGVIQSALGNLPELLVSLFALIFAGIGAPP